jgi:septum formation protein
MANTAVICLASRSPRRRELLRQIGVDFDVMDVDVDEQRRPQEPPDTFVARVALDKARAGRDALPAGSSMPVLGADTAVVIDDEVLGKPRNGEDARRMLSLLSGRTHRVLTAVALVGDRETVLVSSSNVTFRTLGDAECAAYWASGEPADKAGAYAIQGLAAAFISHLEGSYSSVMGLPLYETATLLQESGIRVIK